MSSPIVPGLVGCTADRDRLDAVLRQLRKGLSAVLAYHDRPGARRAARGQGRNLHDQLLPQRYGHVPEIDDGTTTAPGLLQAHLPQSRVVRAFSMINAAEMSGDGHPPGDPRRQALALAGDDPAAKHLVAGLYDEFGFDAIDIGGLDESWRVEAGQPAFVTRQNGAELKANVADARHGS
jgi:hypothetical protein